MTNIVQDSPPADQPGAAAPRRPSGLVNLARMLISVGLLGFILWQVGLDRLAQTLAQANWGLYGVALGLGLVGVVVRAYRWLILLNAVGARVSFGRTVYLYFVGSFFNAFLPTGFGGDVVRVLEIGAGATSAQAAGTAVVDRLAGFLVLFMMTLVILPFAPAALPAYIVWPIAALSVAVVGGSALLFEGRWLRRGLAYLLGLLARTGETRLARLAQAVGRWVDQTYQVILACGWQAIGGAMCVSLFFNISQILAMALIGRAFGLPAPLWSYFLFIPVATTVLLLPITISGLGAREGIFILLYGLPAVGLRAAQATSLSLGVYTLDFSAGVVGGLIYFVAGLAGLRPKSTGAKPE